jgi:WhiB family redox-sensing transcriptional regulator
MSRPNFDLTDAACRGADPDLFFPTKGDSPAAEAKAYCNGTPNRPACPVRRECLRWALAEGEEHGVFGGLTASERRHLGRTPQPGGGTWRGCENPSCTTQFLTAVPNKRYCSLSCNNRARYLRALEAEQVAA